MPHDSRHQPVEAVIPEYGVFALESRHAADFRMRRSRHDFLEVFYVLEGRGRFLLNQESCRCHRDDLVIVPPGVWHTIEDDVWAPLSLYGLCVAPEVWRHAPHLLESLPVGKLSGGRILRPEIKSDLRILLYEQSLQNPWSSSVILGTTLRMLGTLLRIAARPKSASSRLADPGAVAIPHSRSVMRHYIHELQRRFFDQSDLKQTAAHLGMSRRRFTQLFREETGTSWLEYVHRLRVEHACRLLAETERTVESIAFECGYDALSTFYRIFHRRTGYSPGAWRERECDVRPLDRRK